MIHHSKGKSIKFYELNAKFGNYELTRMKWVLYWGSPLFLMTKYFFLSLKLLYIFFTVRGRLEFPYPIRSGLSLVITHISIFLLHWYLDHNSTIIMYGVKRTYNRTYISCYLSRG